MRRKNPAAVALGRKGGAKGGPARAAKLTARQRSESARKAVMARWGKTTVERPVKRASTSVNTSDKALALALDRIRATDDLAEIRRLADQIERIVFHKQFMNA
jgi:hypothetical protein